MDDHIRNALPTIMRVVFFCFGMWLCVFVFGYDANAVGLGALVGILTNRWS
jgi:hypothetical protein